MRRGPLLSTRAPASRAVDLSFSSLSGTRLLVADPPGPRFACYRHQKGVFFICDLIRSEPVLFAALLTVLFLVSPPCCLRTSLLPLLVAQFPSPTQRLTFRPRLSLSISLDYSMSAHVLPPFRADHIGSLKRASRSSLLRSSSTDLSFTAGPAELLAKRADYDAGKCTREELKAVEDEMIRKEVKRQQEIGIKAVTDGEFRRHMFWGAFASPFPPFDTWLTSDLRRPQTASTTTLRA